ncbi:Gluconate 2-dehydrogenase subunit 3 [Catalinimonas alkaloidigena]|uniref:Gluconate 2-dehydrogenase subunit 3 n=1 Tax=Catalinimonas alkaloidigena TaxID=1075417 RepID=A0A1G9KGP7_9BACT|nr:gluconate 2-dehydrogenase subunit 3 family protein [Catalinimonas alkaloidigena]SDL48585.1 Gluconate 2-dehydrogenase subunit 3 [Catalinimonas alkaloidigena]
MNRRSALQNLVLFAGGVMIFPACSRETKEGQPASIELTHLDVSADQEAMMAELVETLIPTTDTAGGKAMGLHLFVLNMVDDCYESTHQEAFLQGMAQFDEMARNQTGESFAATTPEQRQKLVADLNGRKGDDVLTTFYSITKNETIKGYLNSELVMTKLRVYELVPGRYNPLFPIKA